MSGNLLENFSLFQGFSAAEKECLRPLFLFIFVPEGTILFKQGDPAEYLYIIADGEVIIHYKPEDGPTLVLTRVHQEGVVGWSAAIGSRTYTSTAVCAEDSQLLRVRSDDLRHFSEIYPETANLLLERLATMIADRLRYTHPEIMTLLEQGLHIDTSRMITAEKHV